MVVGFLGFLELGRRKPTGGHKFFFVFFYNQILETQLTHKKWMVTVKRISTMVMAEKLLVTIMAQKVCKKLTTELVILVIPIYPPGK